MRELGLAGLVALGFGVLSYYATGELGLFTSANLGFGALALLVSALAGARRLRFARGRLSRRTLLAGMLRVVGALALAVALERAATWSGIRSDWTGEQSFSLSPAVREALADLPGELEATLFYDPLDPRKRRTRMLLETLADAGPVLVREREIAEVPELVDRYGVGSSNTVVLALGERYEIVERPSEGTLYEALYRLRSLDSGVLVLLRGEGEGDPEDSGELGFSGLAVALQTEGYDLRSEVSSALREVPPGTDAVLVIAPRRALRPESVDALRRYLAGGGSLVALLEPGVETGLEPLLAEYGITSEPGVVVDPASGAVDGRPEGLCPVAYSYEGHLITRGLNRGRMTFFCGVRSFSVRKPRPQDQLWSLVLASPRSWVSQDLSLLEQRSGSPEPDGARRDYHAIGVAGRYLRDGREIRIAVFGDSDFASNRYLRALYNLDLVLNAVHWAVQREARITVRPKLRDTVQFPLPIENTLRTFYGVGLLLPELLLIAGGVVWLRRHRA